MEQNSPMKLPKEWVDKIKRDGEAYMHSEIKGMVGDDELRPHHLKYAREAGAMAYAPWLYTCQMNYAALRAKCERMEQALKLIEQMSDPGNEWKAICDMKSIATKALEQNAEPEVPQLSPEQINQRKEAVKWYRNPGGKGKPITFDSNWMSRGAKERFEELKEKQWEWRAFYNGWVEGRADVIQEQLNVGNYKKENEG